MPEGCRCSECSDEIDNDLDTFVDFGQDQQCDDASDDLEGSRSLPECFDNVDNDQDGAIDANDFACQQGGTHENSFQSQCQDGVDNNQDGLIDFTGGDPACEVPKTTANTKNLVMELR